MHIQLTDKDLGEQIQAALLLSISEEAKNKMIGDAVKWMVVPDSGGYGNKKTPLQEAFQYAMQRAANDIISAEFANPESEASKALTGIIQLALAKMKDESSYETIAESFAKSLAEFLGKKSY